MLFFHLFILVFYLFRQKLVHNPLILPARLCLDTCYFDDTVCPPVPGKPGPLSSDVSPDF